jgi:hypothetical protein
MPLANHAASWSKTASGRDGEDADPNPGQTVYSELGWDFSSVWRMDGGYPALR